MYTVPQITRKLSIIIIVVLCVGECGGGKYGSGGGIHMLTENQKQQHNKNQFGTHNFSFIFVPESSRVLLGKLFRESFPFLLTKWEQDTHTVICEWLPFLQVVGKTHTK